MKLTISGHDYEVEVTAESVTVDGKEFRTAVDGFGGTRIVTVNGRAIRVDLAQPGEMSGSVNIDGATYEASLSGSSTPRAAAPAPARAERKTGTNGTGRAAAASTKGAITAQMTGRVIRVAVEAGQLVEQNDLLLVLEAMKMENEIRSPRAGTIKQVQISAGDRVNQGDALVVFDE